MMDVYDELPLFTNLLILLVTARIFGEILERFNQPAMIGEILAGILLGPSLLDIIHRTEAISVISDLGIFMMVIIAGLEIKIDDIIKSLRGRNIIISLTAFFVPMILGLLVGVIFGQAVMTTVFIGLCVAITALPVSIRILMDLGKINTEVGQKIISVAIFDDVLALTILGVLLNIHGTDISVGAIAKAGAVSLLKFITLIAALSITYMFMKNITAKENYLEKGLNKLIDFLKGKETLFALFFAFVLLFATLTETLGFHFIVGAFFASIFISDALIGKKHFRQVEKTTSNMAMGFFAPIFFAGIGLESNISAITSIGLLLAVVAVSYFAKISGGYLGCRLAGLEKKKSFAIGVGLNGRGIMELIIANIAYKTGIISNEIFSILVIMGILTTLTTPSMLKYAFKRLEK